MKKYIEKLAKMTKADLDKRSAELRTEIIDLKKGIKIGDVQNTQATKARRKELARVLTLLNNNQPAEKVEPAPKVKKAAKTATKENK